MRNDRQDNMVLIADDDQFIREVIIKALSGLCSFVEVADGAQLMDIYKESLPDILFLDVHFPDVSGLDLVPQIKAADNDAYIIMLTAASTAENVQKAVSNGAAGFISKPFDRKTLLTNFHRCPTIKA
jgi:two-component system, chemotaxis family, chemotaxis protein CheY